MQPLRKGDKKFLNLAAEGLHLLLAVTVPHHPVVAQLQIILIAHFAGLSGAVFHQLIKNFIQFFRIFRKELTLLPVCRRSDISVRMYQVRTKQRQIQLLAFKRNLSPCNQFIILCLQDIFLLHQRNQLLIHGFPGQLHILKGHGPDLLLKISTVGGFVQLILIRQHQIVQNRPFFIVVILFLTVKLIGGIHIKTNMSYGHLGTHLIRQLIVLLMYRKLLLTALRSVKRFHQPLHFFFNLFEIHSLVRHVLKLHTLFLFSLYYACISLHTGFPFSDSVPRRIVSLYFT